MCVCVCVCVCVLIIKNWLFWEKIWKPNLKSLRSLSEHFSKSRQAECVSVCVCVSVCLCACVCECACAYLRTSICVHKHLRQESVCTHSLTPSLLKTMVWQALHDYCMLKTICIWNTWVLHDHFMTSQRKWRKWYSNYILLSLSSFQTTRHELLFVQFCGIWDQIGQK